MSAESGNPEAEEKRLGTTETVISYVLRIGVILSFAVTVFGIILVLAHNHSSTHESLRQLISADAQFPHTIPAIKSGLMEMRGEAVIALGLLLLILTPIFRVAVSALIFFYQRDRAFTLITLFVLCALLVSFVIGYAF